MKGLNLIYNNIDVEIFFITGFPVKINTSRHGRSDKCATCKLNHQLNVNFLHILKYKD